MPDPMIESIQQSKATGRLDPQILMPAAEPVERASGGEEISLAQFAAQISGVLKQSGKINMQALEPLIDLFQASNTPTESTSGHAIAVHSGILMQLLGEDSHTVEQPSTASREERNIPQPVFQEARSTPPPPSAVQSDCGTTRQTNNSVAQAVSASPVSMSVAVENAVRALSMLKLKVSSVISVARVEDGWRVAIELVERAGVPDTSDVLGVYELRLDHAANVLGYERTHMRRRCDLNR